MLPKKKFILVTGLSGGGKTLALHLLEDLNYYCVDNLPAVLLPEFAEVCNKKGIRQIAVVIDIRGGEFFHQLDSSLRLVKRQKFSLEVLYLEASDEVLVRRFSETRRKHPLAPSGRVLDGIQEERELLFELRGMAGKMIDTSSYSPQELREELLELYSSSQNGKPLEISLLSFGYKYGIPLDADLVFDVRFLPNPYYEETLQNLSGNDKAVRDYVMKRAQTKRFLSFLFPFLNFVIPQYEKEGKQHLTIAVGCTGGRHRSIVLANEILRFLSRKNYPVRAQHRDVDR